MYDTDAIKRKYPLVDYIKKSGVQLKRTGGWMMGYCPFHNDHNTKSFGIKMNGDEPKYFTCFGACGDRVFGFDVIDYVAIELGVDSHSREGFKQTCEKLGGHNEAVDMEALDSAQAERKRKREEAQALSDAEAAEKRKRMIDGKIWDVYHAQIDREWWTTQTKLPPTWQDYWRLGTTDLREDGKAATIPYFYESGFQTMQYRFYHVNGGGKYRFSSGLGSAAFIARPDNSFDQVLVVEGAKKAMVVSFIAGTESKMQVVGIPSQNYLGGILPRLQQSSRVFIWLDREAWIKPENYKKNDWIPWPIRHAQEIGKQAVVVQYTLGKIDDDILDGYLDQGAIRRILHDAAMNMGSRKVK